MKSQDSEWGSSDLRGRELGKVLMAECDDTLPVHSGESNSDSSDHSRFQPIVTK